MFLATGHDDKNSCHSVRGLVKHQATLNNLRSASSAANRLAPEVMAQMGANIENVKLLCENADKLEIFRLFRKRQWKLLPRFPGIRSWRVWLNTFEGTVLGHVSELSRTSRGDLQRCSPFERYFLFTHSSPK